MPKAAPHKSSAFRSNASNTGARSPGDELMTCNTSAVAVCCSSASRVSVISRAFSIAITACAAKFCSRGNLLVGERPHLLAIDRETAEQSTVLAQRHNEKRACAAELDRGDAQPVARPVGLGGPDIRYMDEAFPAQHAAESSLRAGPQRLAREIRV